jgi:hypothetical protein
MIKYEGKLGGLPSHDWPEMRERRKKIAPDPPQKTPGADRSAGPGFWSGCQDRKERETFSRYHERSGFSGPGRGPGLTERICRNSFRIVEFGPLETA